MSDRVAPPPDTLPAPRSRRDPAATRQKWVGRLARFHPTEQTVAAFCVAQGVSVPAFYQWKRVLTAEANPTDPPALVPIRLATASVAPIELVLPGGALLRFAHGTDPAVIVALARQLAVPPC